VVPERVISVIEASAAGLGYELVDLELSQGGLLRVFIDMPDGERMITVEDCESLSNQLVHLLPVEGIDFERLEVSSPGLDRRLSRQSHFERFAGQTIKLKLRQPVGNRKNFEGPLTVLGVNQFQLTVQGEGGEPFALDFELSDIDQARLVPEFSFKEKKR